MTLAGVRPTLSRLLVVLVTAFGGLLCAAVPASAHAYLERADPAPDSTIDRSPSRLTLDFTEPVRVERGSVQVLDPGGRRVDAGNARRGGGGGQVIVDLRPDLPRGTYIVSWRVVSADSHPVSGAYALGVGMAPDTSAAAPAGGAGAGSPAVGYLAGVARAVGTGGLVLLVGGVFFLLAVWPAGLGRRIPRQLLWTGWGATLGAAVASLLLQGPYAAGHGLSTIGSWEILSSAAQSRYGHLVLLRILLLLLAVPLLRGLSTGVRGGRPEPPRSPSRWS